MRIDGLKGRADEDSKGKVFIHEDDGEDGIEERNTDICGLRLDASGVLMFGKSWSVGTGTYKECERRKICWRQGL